MSGTQNRTKKKPFGSIALVGAGPGDPDLLTLRAAALLREADLVLADADVVDLARTLAGAEADVSAALDEDGLPLSHAARAKVVADAAKAGQAVVRLFSGDPLLDGALLTEAGALAKAKVPFDVAPGVSTLGAS